MSYAGPATRNRGSARKPGAPETSPTRSMAAALRMYGRMGFVRAPEHDFRPPGAELVEAYRLPLE